MTEEENREKPQYFTDFIKNSIPELSSIRIRVDGIKCPSTKYDEKKKLFYNYTYFPTSSYDICKYCSFLSKHFPISAGAPLSYALMFEPINMNRLEEKYKDTRLTVGSNLYNLYSNTIFYKFESLQEEFETENIKN